MNKVSQINIIAPNIKSGGGKELLEHLIIHLENVYKDLKVIVYIDSSLTNITSTNRRLVIRLSSTFQKVKLFSKKIDNAIYFGNLPPLVRSTNSIVYFHNPYLILDYQSLLSQSWRFLLKYSLQQTYIKIFLKNVDAVACQNMRMKTEFSIKYNYRNIEVLPFYRSCPKPKEFIEKIYDFCYISLAHPHKNHDLLFDSLEILGKKGFSFSLVVTIEYFKEDLITRLNNINNLYNIKIINMGLIPKEDVCKIYYQTKCLIFPSTYETLGLALIESVEAGLDVIAADLKYTHQVISTPFLFDPQSATSCANVIQEYLENKTLRKCKGLINNKIDDLINRFTGSENVQK
jgi:glycosyltransferase involved in cell wall biosynthesis